MYLVMLEGSPRREENKLQAVVLTWSTLLEWIRRQVSEFKLNITESIIHFASRDKEIMLSLFKSSNCLVNWPCTWMCRWWADGSALGCCLHLPSFALYSASSQGLWFSYGVWKIPCPTAEPATKISKFLVSLDEGWKILQLWIFNLAVLLHQ